MSAPTIFIRLQNLPIEANSLDIRRFFQGLQIPDGGVHIVGGDNGDAFIGFIGDDDARQAMGRHGNQIKGSKIQLQLSSAKEMQRVIDCARTGTVAPASALPVGGGPNMQAQQAMAGYNPYGQMMQDVLSHHAQSFPQQQQPPQQQQQQQPQQHLPRSKPDPFGRVAGPQAHFGRPRSRSRSRSPPARNEPTMHGGLPLPLNGPAGGGGGFGGGGGYPNGSTNGLTGNGGGGGGGYDRQAINDPYGYNRGGGAPQQPAALNPSFGAGGDANRRDDRWAPQAQPQQQQQQQQQPPASDGYRGGVTGQFNGSEMYQRKPSYENAPPMVQYNPPYAGGAPTMQPVFKVQLSNLPFSAGRMDIIHFFAPLNLREENVQVFLDDKYQPTGLGQATFNSPREFDMALGYSNRLLLGSPIDIRPIATGEPSPVLPASQQPAPPQQHPAPTMYGQPSGAGPNIAASAANAGMEPPAYTANYNFSSAAAGYESANHASSMANMPVYTGPPSTVPVVPTGPAPGNKDLVVFMKGLPFNQCTPRHVADFFHPIVLAHIEIEMERDRPTGNAFVEFRNEAEYNRGMEYDHKHMGHRYIELIPFHRLNKSRYPFNGPPGGAAAAGMMRKDETFPILVRGFPVHFLSKDVKEMLSAEPVAVHVSNAASNVGQAYLEFATRSAQLEAARYDGMVIDAHYRISVTPVSYQDMISVIREPAPEPMRFGAAGRPAEGGGGGYQADRRGGDRFRNRDTGPRRGGRDSPPRRDSQPPFSSKPAILVFRDLPKRATDDDLCTFFADFDITPDRIRRIGMHDAKISFHSEREADRAMRALSRKFFVDGNAKLEHFFEYERKKNQ